MFDPGDRWEYGISIDWAGKMVEAVSGQRLDRYFQENIFGPLRMKGTSVPISPSQPAPLASVHQRGRDRRPGPSGVPSPSSPQSTRGGERRTGAPPHTRAAP